MSEEEKTEVETGDLPEISAKHDLFVDNFFLRQCNQTDAYLDTYPSVKKRSTARRLASRLMTNEDIKKHVAARFAEMRMSQTEAETLLADMARGDLGDFLNDMNIVDLTEARQKGITKLIKKFRQRTVTKIGKKDDDEDVEITDIEIELHDPQSAIDKILRVQGAYKDKVAVTDPDGQPLGTNIIRIMQHVSEKAE